MSKAVASHGVEFGVANRFFGLGQMVRNQVNEFVRRAQLRRELESLSAREMSDMGISPADFGAIVNGSWQRAAR
ncbi:DUF1127 domain-containing protein [Radicibacter daui]|uniref:DUF1127 domain-containing protein n=1 Tax=Radicibacter daui TaxID=3064829 RepID=UPI004046A0C8